MATPRLNLLLRPRNWLFAALLLVLLGLTFVDWEDVGGGEAGEDRVALADVPAPVQAAIAQESKTGTLLEIDKTTVDGNPAYAARLRVNGKQQITRIGGDGKVIDRAAAKEDDDDDD